MGQVLNIIIQRRTQKGLLLFAQLYKLHNITGIYYEQTHSSGNKYSENMLVSRNLFLKMVEKFDSCPLK